MTKITLIFGGSDWHDANFYCVILPPKTTIENEASEYKKWYRDVYLKQEKLDTLIKYKSLHEFVIERGGRLPDDNELELFEEF